MDNYPKKYNDTTISILVIVILLIVGMIISYSLIIGEYNSLQKVNSATSENSGQNISNQKEETSTPPKEESTTSEKPSSSEPTQKEESSNKENNTDKPYAFKVGETGENNTLRITYISLDDNFRGYNRYADIKDGYKVIKAEFEFENLSTQDEYVSSYDFECYADGYACENFYSVDDSSFSTKLSAGKKTKGAVYFEVPKDANNIILEYELNYWTDSKAVFIVK